MCQLTFVNLRDRNWNVTADILQTLVNCNISHKDGFGVFYDSNKVEKTALCPHNLYDFANFFIPVKTAKPIISHVRLASFGTEKTIENVHPFFTDNFTLAHNGTLTLKEEFKGLEPKEKILDSKLFLLLMDKEYMTNGQNFIPAITTTMEKFTGKFAFLIYEQKTKNYYAVVGNTADLHIIYFENSAKEVIGYIINTEEKSLDFGAQAIENVLAATGGDIRIVGVESAARDYISSLESETIYRLLPKEIKKIGEIKENRPVVKTYTSQGARQSSIGVGESHSENILKATKFMDTFGLGVTEFDLIFYGYYGKPIVESSEIEFNYFVEEIINKISAHCRKELKKEAIKFITTWGGIPEEFYVKYGFQYPYFINSDWKGVIQKLRELSKEYDLQVEESKKKRELAKISPNEKKGATE